MVGRETSISKTNLRVLNMHILSSHLLQPLRNSRQELVGGSGLVCFKGSFIIYGMGGGIREKVSYGVANCALGYFGVLLLDP